MNPCRQRQIFEDSLSKFSTFWSERHVPCMMLQLYKLIWAPPRLDAMQVQVLRGLGWQLAAIPVLLQSNRVINEKQNSQPSSVALNLVTARPTGAAFGSGGPRRRLSGPAGRCAAAAAHAGAPTHPDDITEFEAFSGMMSRSNTSAWIARHWPVAAYAGVSHVNNNNK